MYFTGVNVLGLPRVFLGSGESERCRWFSHLLSRTTDYLVGRPEVSRNSRKAPRQTILLRLKSRLCHYSLPFYLIFLILRFGFHI